MPIDFTNLSIVALFTLLLMLTAMDVGGNIVLAIKAGTFSAAYVADFIKTHIIARVFAIGALGILGQGVPALGVPPIPAVALATTGVLAAYAVETFASLQAAARGDTQPPTT